MEERKPRENSRENSRRGNNPRRNRKNNRRQRAPKEFETRVVTINRVTKVVKGGRKMRFAALVVIGDRKGRVGFGTGKATEVPDAIRKAEEAAKRNLITVPNINGTIPHEITGNFKSGSVFLRPAAKGTGIIAGGPSRIVLELAGYKNIRSKSLGSNNKQNVVFATIDALGQLKSPEEVAKLRGKSVEEILG